MNANAPPDLFALNPADADRAYANIRNLADSEMAVACRRACEELWADYWRDADEHFLAEFPKRFHQRWFEMHLTVALKRLGLNATCPKPGPDVLVEANGRRVWIEATAPTGGAQNNQDAVPEPQAGSAFWVPKKEIVLRVAGAIDAKAKAFQQYIRDGRVRPDDACIIAVNVRAVPHAAYDAADYFQGALYAVGDEYVLIDRDSLNITGAGFHRRPEVQRARGAVVDTQMFLTDRYRHVSAVIGSWADVANGPTRLGDDFLIFPNPCAAVPYPTGLIERGREWLLTAEGEGWRPEVRDHIQRD